MNDNEMLFNFTKLDKQGEIKEVINSLNLTQLEIIIKSLYNYSIELKKQKTKRKR